MNLRCVAILFIMPCISAFLTCTNLKSILTHNECCDNPTRIVSQLSYRNTHFSCLKSQEVYDTMCCHTKDSGEQLLPFE